MNILIIEDDPTDMKLLSAVLDANGHTVLGKRTAEEAAEEIRQHRPDLILLDLRLPGMDGITLAKMLKTDPATKQIPVIVVTAAEGQFSRKDVLALGIDAFVQKPINTREISAEVSRVITKSSSPHENPHCR